MTSKKIKSSCLIGSYVSQEFEKVVRAPRPEAGRVGLDTYFQLAYKNRASRPKAPLDALDTFFRHAFLRTYQIFVIFTF